MSTTERKARKRAGIPLTREPKVGTPFLRRGSFLRLKLAQRVRAVTRRDGAEAATAYAATLRRKK